MQEWHVASVGKLGARWGGSSWFMLAEKEGSYDGPYLLVSPVLGKDIRGIVFTGDVEEPKDTGGGNGFTDSAERRSYQRRPEHLRP